MKLRNLQDETLQGLRRISMELDWEDVDRPRQLLYFEAMGETARLMQPNPNAFAIACLPLAIWLGEKRLEVEGRLCTRLRSGLRVINRVVCDWFPDRAMVEVQPTDGFHPTMPPIERRTATLLSGGVDGLTTLRINRLDYPLDHPESIRACITLFGINKFDIDEKGEQVPDRLAAFDLLLQRLQTLGEAEHFDVHPVRTNVRSLAPNYYYWTRIGFGAGHSAVCQLFQGYFDKVLLASDGAGPNPSPVAAHPLFNHHFSTDAVRIQGEQDEMDRVEKIRILADWEYGRRFMQPCHYVRIPKNNAINCGRCEKCVRTMLTLIGLNRLADVDAFEENDLKARHVFLIPVNSTEKAKLLRQSIPLLQQVGRRDLIWAIRARLAVYRVVRR